MEKYCLKYFIIFWMCVISGNEMNYYYYYYKITRIKVLRCAIMIINKQTKLHFTNTAIEK